jgi:2-desacetyl-2-hydroxyethyl bacteriochlorophyllide A dehydrogenase
LAKYQALNVKQANHCRLHRDDRTMSDGTARAFWITAPGRGEIRSERLESRAPDDVVVRAEFSAISRGTESLVFQGRVPASERDRMRAPFQAGDFPGPIKYGYASVGLVEDAPRDLLGRHVFVLYPHQTRYIVPADSAWVLPDGVPPGRAVLAANLETAVNGLWDAAPQLGDRVTVIGGGTVGCLVAWLAGLTAADRVELVDINPQRASVAGVLGVSFSSPDAASPDADVVIHASGSPSGLETALRIAGFEATIVEMSWYGTNVVPISLGAAFHARRLTIKSSQVGTIAASQRARWNAARRMALVLDLLQRSVLDALITGESRFDDLPEVMSDLATRPGDTICHRIRY